MQGRLLHAVLMGRRFHLLMVVSHHLLSAVAEVGRMVLIIKVIV